MKENQKKITQFRLSRIPPLTTDNNHFTNAQGRWVCPLDYFPELDGAWNPAINTETDFVDSPWVPLPFQPGDTEGEVERSFNATTYLMWTPNAAAGCTGGEACAIEVPLATLSWSWTGDAINTLQNQNNGSTWTLTGCQTCSNGQPQPTASYPQWDASTKSTNGCQPSLMQ